MSVCGVLRTDGSAFSLAVTNTAYDEWLAGHNSAELWYHGMYVGAPEGLVTYYEDALDINNEVIHSFVGNTFDLAMASDGNITVVHKTLSDARKSISQIVGIDGQVTDDDIGAR